MKKPVKPELPAQLWVMYMSGDTMAGSFNHVSSGEKFYRTREECQAAIDTMEGWLGMGDRKRYRPLLIVSGEAANA